MCKKYLIITLALLLLGVFHTLSSAGPWNGWIYQNPYPTSNTLLAVKFITPKKGWIAGEKGTILYTEDGGDTWEAQESGTEQDIKSIIFVNEKTGWAAGDRGVIIHTEDGGKTWVAQGDIISTLNKVYFVNEKEGWAVGNEGTVLHTIDGGKKWEKINAGIWRTIASIYFIDSKSGWIIAGDEISRTVDGGKTWEKTSLNIKIPRSGKAGRGPMMSRIDEQMPPDWAKGDIFFSDHKNGWAVIGLYFIFHTTDGGKTWETKDLGFMTYGLSTIAFSDEKHGCVGGTTIFCTEDGGKTWQERMGVKAGERETVGGSLLTIWGISFPEKTTGMAIGFNGQIMKTEDSGKSWNAISRGQHYFAYFLDPKTGWDVGYDDKSEKGSIIKTEDGGETWKVQKKFDSRVDMKLVFVDSKTGWAVGEKKGRTRSGGGVVLSYFILHTSDGGETWASQFEEKGGQKGIFGGSADIFDEFSDGFFLSPSVGWVVGSQGIILHTEDGGEHWEQQKSGTKFRLRKIRFIDDRIGWAIGEKSSEGHATGIILHTVDGGEHWQAQWKKKTDWMGLRDLSFVDEKIGWVMGNIAEYSGDALLISTSDGGKTWKETEFKEISYKGMFFIDKYQGAILTKRGYVFVTRDGGKTWEKQRMPLRKYPWHISEVFGGSK